MDLFSVEYDSAESCASNESPTKSVRFATSSKRNKMRSTPNARNSTSFRARRPSALFNTPTKSAVQIYDSDDDKPPLSDAAKGRRDATNAIDSLQPIPNTTWNPDMRKAIEENINAFWEASADRSKGRAKSQTPTTPTKAGKKRRRSSSSSDESDSHVKRIKPSGAIKIQPQLDIVDLNPQPLCLEYVGHPNEDRSDIWYTIKFRDLWKNLEKFVEDYYCIHDLDQGAFFDPWGGVEMIPEFITWIEQVAEPDPVGGGWDALLKDTRQRKWLLMGVIMKILKVKIFDGDLFGSDEEQKKLLFSIERVFLGSEGYTRTALRATTVRSIMGGAPVTKLFYEEVAILTAQITLLMEPLTTYLYSIIPPNDKDLPTIQSLYQELHNLVSQAGYLSLCIRLSPTIFHFVDLHPGTFYDDDDQHNLSSEIYTASKDAIHTLHKKASRRWKQQSDAVQDELETRFPTEARRNTKAGLALQQKANDLLTQQPEQPSYTFRARCKISVWPVINRYKPGGDEDDKYPDRPLCEKDGQRIFQIAKAAVVCYYGNGNTGAPRLKHYHRERRAAVVKGQKKNTGAWKVGAGIGAMALGLLAMGQNGGTEGEAIFGKVAQMASNIGGMVRA